MNKIRLLVLAILTITGVMGQVSGNRYPAQITFRVLTEEGEPVPNVDVTTSTFLYWQPGEGFGKDIYEENNVRTDINGLATVTFRSERGDCNYGIYNAPGYYSTRNLNYRFKEVSAERWEPWSPTIEVVCKPIVKPIPMYARKVGQVVNPIRVPLIGKPVGFDLVVGDWISPYGKGLIADLVVTFDEIVPATKENSAFEFSLKIAFSNKGDGIQPVFAPPFKGSELRLPRYAPQTAYEAELVKWIGRSTDGRPKYPPNREDQNYFIRIRTVLDEKGNIKSALYGKITGDFRFGVSRQFQFTYYINPEPLDRNMEFDRKQNLFEDLTSLEAVNEP